MITYLIVTPLCISISIALFGISKTLSDLVAILTDIRNEFTSDRSNMERKERNQQVIKNRSEYEKGNLFARSILRQALIAENLLSEDDQDQLNKEYNERQ
jgi:hypothetical protein